MTTYLNQTLIMQDIIKMYDTAYTTQLKPSEENATQFWKTFKENNKYYMISIPKSNNIDISIKKIISEFNKYVINTIIPKKTLNRQKSVAQIIKNVKENEKKAIEHLNILEKIKHKVKHVFSSDAENELIEEATRDINTDIEKLSSDGLLNYGCSEIANFTYITENDDTVNIYFLYE
jgi:hypothetical protein